jgi:hypothetical protein
MHTLSPPTPPPDNIQSALFLPISSLGAAHSGQKIRTIGQCVHSDHSPLASSCPPSTGTLYCATRTIQLTGRILSFNVDTALVLLSAAPTPTTRSPEAHGSSALSTLLVSLSVPLSSQSSTLPEMLKYYGVSVPPPDKDANGRPRGALVNRERLTLARGEWITVIGWLEGDGRRLAKRVSEGLAPADSPLTPRFPRHLHLHTPPPSPSSSKRSTSPQPDRHPSLHSTAVQGRPGTVKCHRHRTRTSPHPWPSGRSPATIHLWPVVRGVCEDM